MGKDLKGVFITFEGSEGSGKSTQAKRVCDYLKERQVPAMHIREPGGVKISESIRRILLDVKNTQMTDECEVLLYMAARSQLVGEVIVPALKKGTVVICDRYIDSTVVYQGYGNGVDMRMIKAVGEFATKSLMPDLTVLFDIDTKRGLSRTGKQKDRIEQRSLMYHNRVRKGYLDLAKKEPDRIKVVKVDKSKEAVFAEVREMIDQLLGAVKCQ